jgi:putative tryptophan/tyrosine transport system substrate-binding protein
MSRVTRRRAVQGAGALGLALLTACGRLPGQTPPAKVARVGWLIPASVEVLTLPEPAPGSTLGAFIEGMLEYGYVLGQNYTIEYRATNGGPERLTELATELARLPVDVVLAHAAAPPAARRATESIPIVIVGGGDPVASGLVPSLARPGGNVTGVTSQPGGPLQPKMIELLKETVPSLSRVGFLYDANFATPSLEPNTMLGSAAHTLGLHIELRGLRGAADVEPAITAAVQGGIDGLVTLEPPFLFQQRTRVAELARQHRLPTIFYWRESAAAGLLMSYGPSLLSLNRRAAYYVDRILKGTSPVELPIEQPMRFDFVINLQTAQALGLTIPPHVLLQTTELIH